MAKCIYYKECKYYDKTSNTCNIGGEEFCGKYREYRYKKLLNKSFKRVKLNKFSFDKLVLLVENYNKHPENTEKKTLGSFLEGFIDDCYQYFIEKGRIS